MTDTASWIAGLMRHNYDAVGFIPEPTIQYRYVALGRYILQADERGRNVGYLLHGALQSAAPAVISQHLIDYDYRRRHYGAAALAQFLDRCERANVSSIHLRVAEDLDAVHFWQACGFQIDGTEAGGMARNRTIVKMFRLLAMPMFPSRAPAT